MSISINLDLTTVYDQLSKFAHQDNFWQFLEAVYGNQYDSSIVISLQSQWQQGNFSQLPNIKIVDGNILDAKGAYANGNNTIYLSDSFVQTASQSSLTAVILEEIGHFVDAQIKTTDTQGDEGEYFANVAQGIILGADELNKLKAEDDHAVMVLDGEIISIEQASLTPFTVFTSTDNVLLTNALLGSNSGITINTSSIILNVSAQDAVNFYDGSLTALGISSGLLLTSGTTPGTINTSSGFGNDNSGTSGFDNGDADINAVVNTVFQTQSYDATSLVFDFTVADPTATSISFDVVFGSDEYPEWVDAFVDSAIVMVNGVNYALFNHDPLHPLSVVSSNLAAGYFQDNSTNALPIEYDGVSRVLKIVAPINGGGANNHIKIAIADTGDHILDSGIFIANLSAGNTPGSGVVSTPTDSTTDSSDVVTGSAQDELIDLKGGDDIAYAGSGDDIVVCGGGNDSAYGGSGNDQLKGDGGDDYLDGGDGTADTAVFIGLSSEYNLVHNAASANYTIADSKTVINAEGIDTLINVEFAQFSNGLFEITTSGLIPVSAPPPAPTNTPGLVILSGVASAGNVLTATVSDADGISGSITYQWQSSSDNGVTWNNVGDNSNSYTVASADIGDLIQVIANYTDNGAIAESPISAPKTILQTNTGDLVVTLMQLKAPSGASNVNPLTTLVQDAIDLGLSPNTAAIAIKTVLGLPSSINLQSYDAYGILQTNPTNAEALAVETVAVQTAILTSLSDDDTGLNLTSAIINANANNKTLNLANADDLANILGVDITGLTKDNYPQPLKEIFDRNKSMSEAIADGGDISVIEQEWQDLLSIQDGIQSTSIADLSIHINQAPIGTATASLMPGTEGSPYTLNATDLLVGFSDPDGGTLSVNDLIASVAGTFTENLNVSYTFTPDNINYNGPVELTYTVIDGQGGSLTANQLFVLVPSSVVPPNNAPIGTATATLGNGTEDTIYVINSAELLQGLSDPDGDSLSVSGLTANHGSLVNNNNNTWTFTPNSNYNGIVDLSYNVIDGNGGTLTANQSFSLTAVNDAPIGTATATLVNGTENNSYVIKSVDLLLGFSDPDGDSLMVDSLTANNGSLVNNNNGTWTFTPNANYSGTVNLGYNIIDGHGGILTATQQFLLSPASTTFTGTSKADTLTGTTGADTLIGLAGNDTYIVNHTGDIVVENANAGTDTVKASISYVLGANIENLVLTGVDAINGTGNSLKNVITGNSGNNLLSGDAGNDTLTGNAGSDILVGGLGNDTLSLGLNDGVADIIRYASGEGTDVINQFVKGIDKLAFTGISFIDVKVSRKDTQLRLGNGIAGDAGFGTGTLLETIKGVTGFTSAYLGVGGSSVDSSNTAQFLFS